MVTLVGPGGTGKTSLAAALGAQLLSSVPDGVFFVDLSALNDPALVIPALAQTLALKETPGRTLTQSLATHLSSKDMLVILDNFEQVIEAAPEVSGLLTEAPSLKVVVTSREALRIQGERVVSLAPLELPSPEHDDLDEVARSAAVALFTERARAVKRRFRPHPGQRRRHRCHLQAPGRPAPRSRARCGPHQPALSLGPARPSRSRPQSVDLGETRCGPAPEDAQGSDRVELRAFVPRRADPLQSPRGLRRRLEPPSRRAGV